MNTRHHRGDRLGPRLLFGLCILLFSGLAALAPVAAEEKPDQGWKFTAGSIVHSVAIAADGSAAVIGSRNGTLFYLDAGGQKLWQYEAGGTVLAVAVSRDGKQVLAGTEGRAVFLLDGTGKLIWKKDFDFVIYAVAMSGDGSLISIVPKNMYGVVFDNAGNLLWEQEFEVQPLCTAVSDDGKRVAFGLRDAYVYVYDGAGKEIWNLQEDGIIRGISFTSDGGSIVIGDEASAGYLVRGNSAEPENEWTFEAEGKVTSAAVSADGQIAAFGSNDKAVYFVDAQGKVKFKHETAGRVTSVALSGSGALCAAGSEDGTVYGFVTQTAQAGYATGKTRSLIYTIVGCALGVLLIAGIILFFTYVPSGQRFWDVRGAGIRTLSRRIWRARISYFLLFPTVALLLVFNYYPAFSGLLHSFTKWKPGVITAWAGLDNFEAILHNEFFWRGLLNSVILTVTGYIKLLAPLIVAELIFHLRSTRVQYWMRTLFIILIVVPGVALTLVWRNIFDPNIGLLNNFLALFGAMDMRNPQAWLGDTRTAIWSIVFMGFPWVSPFALLLFYGGLIAIPTELFDAAKVDGASTMKRFWSLEFPMMMGQIKLLLILGFIGGMQEFSTIFLTTEGGPYNATYTPALELYYQAMRFSNFGLASAMGTVLFVIILGGTIINNRYVRSSVEFVG